MTATEKFIMLQSLSLYIHACECEDTKEGSIRANDARRLREELISGKEPRIPRDIFHGALQLLREREEINRVAAAQNLLIIDDMERRSAK